MKPLGMNESAASYSRLQNKKNVIDPHTPVEGKVQVTEREMNETLNAAGGIYSSVYDMSKWAIMQMNNGVFEETGVKKQLFSDEVHNDMWTIHTVIPLQGKTTYSTNFSGYGLGWSLRDEMGHKVATHTGGLQGVVTQVTLIPDMMLGIIVFTNQQSGAAFISITNSIKDAYYGIKGKDRIQEYYTRAQKDLQDAKQVTDKIWKDINAASNSQDKIDLKSYTGTFQDAWFGKIEISINNGQLYFKALKSAKLCGYMSFYRGTTFVVKWEDRSLDADAFVNFSLNFNGEPSQVKMRPISPLTDFSFDFQDLDFLRVK